MSKDDIIGRIDLLRTIYINERNSIESFLNREYDDIGKEKDLVFYVNLGKKLKINKVIEDLEEALKLNV
jgi:hypothetical protein